MTTIVYPDADPTVLASLARTGLDERLARLGRFTHHLGDPPDAQDFLARVGDAEIVLLGSNLPSAVLREAPRLRLVSFTGLGAANFVDLDVAAERGILVGCTPGYGAESVAEHALALALAVARAIPRADDAARSAEWTLPPSTQLSGKTAGIIGYGAIGRRAAELFRGIGMGVLVWARRPPESAPAGIEFCTIEQLLKRSDLVSVHLSLNDGTRGILTAEQLSLIRPGGILVNTARAELIAPDALEDAIAAGHLRAGLDVFTAEPLPPDARLATLEGTVLTPHQGYNTPHALDSLMTIAVDNIDGFLHDRPIHTA